MANGSDSWFHESIRWPIWFSGGQHQSSVSQILTLELCPHSEDGSPEITHENTSDHHQSIKLHYNKHRLGRYQFNASKGMKLKVHNSKMNCFLAYGKDKRLHSVYDVSSQRHQYCSRYLHSIITLTEVLISSSLLMTYFLFFSSVPHWTKNTPLC